jgi:hypothetical protein
MRRSIGPVQRIGSINSHAILGGLHHHYVRFRFSARTGGRSIKGFVRHILESWVLAQHVYWSVGRGLADARAGGKTILRLKVVLEEGGWTLAPGASQISPPQPTPDRLQTALNLADECGLLA